MIHAKDPVPVKYFMEPGYIFLAAKPTLISGVAGSSVSVCIYDRKRKYGGMNLFQYPKTDDKALATGRYGNVATLALIRMMVDNGSKPRHMEAQIVGGAYNREVSPEDIGRENVMIARRILMRHRIAVTSEDIGGAKGRKIIFNTHLNEIAVMKVDKLRKGDWFPYEDRR